MPSGLVVTIKNRLPAMTRAVQAEVSRAVEAAALVVEGNAKRAMTEPKHGKVYERRKKLRRYVRKKTGEIRYSRPKGTRSHTASAPGEAPAVDFGFLRASLRHRMRGPMVAEVTANTDYAAELEFGSRRVKARPYLRPAAIKATRKFELLVAGAIKRAAEAGP